MMQIERQNVKQSVNILIKLQTVCHYLSTEKRITSEGISHKETLIPFCQFGVSHQANRVQNCDVTSDVKRGTPKPDDLKRGIGVYFHSCLPSRSTNRYCAWVNLCLATLVANQKRESAVMSIGNYIRGSHMQLYVYISSYLLPRQICRTQAAKSWYKWR